MNGKPESDFLRERRNSRREEKRCSALGIFVGADDILQVKQVVALRQAGKDENHGYRKQPPLLTLAFLTLGL